MIILDREVGQTKISDTVYENFFSASRKTLSRGGTVGGVPGVSGPLVGVAVAFARRARSAWMPFSNVIPPP